MGKLEQIMIMFIIFLFSSVNSMQNNEVKAGDHREAQGRKHVVLFRPVRDFRKRNSFLSGLLEYNFSIFG